MLDNTGTLMVNIIRTFIESLQKRQDLTDYLISIINVFQFYLDKFPNEFNQLNTFCQNCSSNEFVDQFINENSLDFKEKTSQPSVCGDSSNQISSAVKLTLTDGISPQDQDNRNESNHKQIISSETLQIDSSPSIQQVQKTVSSKVIPPLPILTLPAGAVISSFSLSEIPITTKRYSPIAITNPDGISNEQFPPESFQNDMTTSNSNSNNNIKEEGNYIQNNNQEDLRQIICDQAIDKDLLIQQNYLEINPNDNFQQQADDYTSNYVPMSQYDHQPQQIINYGNLDYTDEAQPTASFKAAQWTEIPAPSTFQQLPPLGYNKYIDNIILPNSIPLPIPPSVPFSFTPQLNYSYPVIDSQHLYQNDFSQYQYQYQREVEFNPRKLLELVQNNLQTMKDNSKIIIMTRPSSPIRSIAEEYRFVPRDNLQFDLKHSMKKSLKNLVVYAHKDRIKASVFKIESDIRREMHNAKKKVNQWVFQSPNFNSQQTEQQQTNQQSLSSKYMLERNRNNNPNEISRNINNNNFSQQQLRLQSNSPHQNYPQINSDFQIAADFQLSQIPLIPSHNNEYLKQQEQQKYQNNNYLNGRNIFNGISNNDSSHKNNNNSSRLYSNDTESSSPLHVYSLKKPKDTPYNSTSIYKQNHSSGFIQNNPSQQISQDGYNFNSFLNSKHLYIEDQQIY